MYLVALRRRLPLMLAVAGATLIGSTMLAGCGGEDESPEDSGRSITLKMSAELRFEPEQIRVKAGQPVTLKIDNTRGGVLHDFAVQEIAVGGVHHDNAESHSSGGSEPALHLAVKAKKRGALEFTPLEPGKYEFLCTVPGHAQAGMKGTLIVEG